MIQGGVVVRYDTLNVRGVLCSGVSLLVLSLLLTFTIGVGNAWAQSGNYSAEQWWNTLNADQMVKALYGDTATPKEETAAKNMYADLDAETKQLVNDAAARIYPTAAAPDNVFDWWESLDCELMRIAAGDGNTAYPASPYCGHLPGTTGMTLLGKEQQEHVYKVGQALLGLEMDIFTVAEQWWNALDAEQMVKALHGDRARSEQVTAARNMYADLDAVTKGLVDALAAMLYTQASDNVFDWWESLDCRKMRIATGDGNMADPNSPYCGHLPGSGKTLLMAEYQEHVYKIGQALLGLEMDILTAAEKWWNALNAEQMVKALHGDMATPEDVTAAQNMYADLDAVTKGLVTTLAAMLYTQASDSVFNWWESLDCRKMRIATGDGNTNESTTYCRHLPGSGKTLLREEQQEHVYRVGEALLGLDSSEPEPEPEPEPGDGGCALAASAEDATTLGLLLPLVILPLMFVVVALRRNPR